MEVLHGQTAESCRGAGGYVAAAVSTSEESLWVAYLGAEDSPSGFQQGSCTITLLQRSLATHQPLCSAAVSHRQPVEALALSPGGSLTLLLCSASHGSILLWDVEAVCKGVRLYPKELPSGDTADKVAAVSFSPTGLYLAVSKGNTVSVYHTQSCVLDTTLLGHSALISCVLFTTPNPVTVVSLSHDRTFKVWDLQGCTLTFQSHVVSSSPFLCGAVNMHAQQLAMGTADGMVRVYDLTAGGQFRCLMEADMSKSLQRLRRHTGDLSPPADFGGRGGEGGGAVIQARVSQGGGSGRGREVESAPSAEAGCCLLSMAYVWCDRQESGDMEVTRSAEPCGGLEEDIHLLVLMQMNLLRLNGKTLELLEAIDFSDPVLAMDGSGVQVPALGSGSFAGCGSQAVVVVGGALFSEEVAVLSVRLPPHIDHSASQDDVLSVLSDRPLLESSPLSSSYILKTKGSSTAGSRTHVGRPGKSGRPARPGGPVCVTDQPLTFKSKVKSSGYSTAPRMTMFTAKPKGKASSTAPARTNPSAIAGGDLKRAYPVSSVPPSHPHCTRKLADKSVPLYSSEFNGSGSMLLCAAADHSAYVVKMPPTSPLKTFTGHDGAVVCTNWSHSEQWFVTSSADKSVRVWDVRSKDTPLMVLDRTEHNLKASDKAKNQPFKKDITFAQFYYLDKFILLTSGNSLYLYKYHIDTSTPDDITRYLSNSCYKLATSFQLHDAQSITALSAINSFHSYLVLVAGSNRSLHVYDMNVERSVRTLPDAHSRAVHCIAQSKGSKYITHPGAHYDLFTTSAVTDGIKLWDLRSNRCVCRYASHTNQCQPHVLACVSPCAQFLASGSEDRCAYVYDLRHPSPLHRLQGHSDTVSAVTFNPLTPMLATGTLDGQIKFFTESDIK